MDKKVVLAVAGSGKTYHLCNIIDETKRNIIIAYTNENIKNIRNEICKRFKFIPENTKIMTFHSFIYKYMIRPFDSIIGEYYGVNNFVSKGISISNPPEKSYKQNGYWRKNPLYSNDKSLQHYTYNDKYYCDYLSKLIMKTNNKKISLLKYGCENINRFFDCIYIDEMQDFRENNWELLVEIIKNVNNIILVGDYYQHSVNATNNTGKPFKIKTKYIGYMEYIEYLKNIGLNVDDKTLIKSRRCSKEVCEFIKKKLGIEIKSNEINNGRIIVLDDPSEITNIIEDDDIVKLVWNSTENYKFNAVTWGYSKGDTYENVCVILTDKYSKLNEECFIRNESILSTNKLYVALTRSKGNVYLLKKSQLNEK